ncbi:MAG: hypothetical protein ISS66_14755 [Desulfobacteraceae bacterium]|nr:hypothetical protein [Desulfobacteraceae bacterium]
MTNRERFRAIANFERPGDLWITDGFWQETLISWIEHGALAKPRWGGISAMLRRARGQR